MYFDPEPKKMKKDLYDFDAEYQELITALNDTKVKFIALYGLRRTGKTSLLMSTYHGLTGKKLYIDVRQVYPLTPISFSSYFVENLVDMLKDFNLVELLLGKIKGIEFGVKVELRENSLSVTKILEKLDTALGNHHQKLVIFIDEAQLLKAIGFDQVLAYLYDRCTNIKIIVAGSEIGILDKLLGQQEDAPLFGRAIKKITLKKLSRNQAIEFLTIGFKQLKMAVSINELEDAFKKVDGSIGWLTLLGWYSFQEKKVSSGIKKVVHEGSKMAHREFLEFLKNREIAKKRYEKILRSLSLAPLRWRDIKSALELEEKKKISNKQVSEYLSHLLDYGFIEKEGIHYRIADPLLKEAFLQ